MVNFCWSCVGHEVLDYLYYEQESSRYTREHFCFLNVVHEIVEISGAKKKSEMLY